MKTLELKTVNRKTKPRKRLNYLASLFLHLANQLKDPELDRVCWKAGTRTVAVRLLLVVWMGVAEGANAAQHQKLLTHWMNCFWNFSPKMM